MTRSSTFQNPQKQIVQTIEDQHKYDLPTHRRLDVVASPVNKMVTPFVSEGSSSAARLAGALNIKAPLFEKFLNERVDNFNQEEAARGEKESREGNPADVTSLAFYKSYMKTQGYLGAMKDQEAMQQEWESHPKVDDQGNPVAFSQWSQDWWKKNTAGLEDKDYLEGYMPVMTKTFHATQLKDAEERTKNLIESRNGATREVLKNTLTEAAKAGGFDMTTYEAVRQSGINMGMTPAEVNAEFVTVLAEMAKNPQSELDVMAVQMGAELLKQKHSDGTPGFAKWATSADTMANHVQRLWDNKVQAEEDRRKHEEKLLKHELTADFSDNVADLIESNKDPMALMQDEKYSILDRTKMMSTIRRAQRVWKQTQAGTAPVFDKQAMEMLRDQVEKAQGDPVALDNLRMDAYATYQSKGARPMISRIFSSVKSPKTDPGYQDGLSFLADSHKVTANFIGSDTWAPAKRDYQNRWEEAYYMDGKDLALAFPKEIPEEFKGRPLYEMPIPVKRKIGFALAEQYAPKKPTSGSAVGKASRPLNGGNIVPQKGESISLPNGVVVGRID